MNEAKRHEGNKGHSCRSLTTQLSNSLAKQG